MVNSMTGFAAHEGSDPIFSWSWEMRSVNGRGLDIRLRVPDRMVKLEPKLREQIVGVVGRGNVSLSLRLSARTVGTELQINQDALTGALAAISHVTSAAGAQGVALTPSTPAEILALRGVFEAEPVETVAPDDAALLADFALLLAEFLAMRAREGQSLDAILQEQLTQMAQITNAAAARADLRQDAVAETLRQNIQKVLSATDGVDEGRLTQELALLAIKADITEEIDRLRAHVAAARDLLAMAGPVGRKLDFLMQEFNREANTLCSKSSDIELTQLGLDLKVLIDQMREQVQNVE
jgi:uncharacterized protein (TIGR00255 family)